MTGAMIFDPGLRLTISTTSEYVVLVGYDVYYYRSISKILMACLSAI